MEENIIDRTLHRANKWSKLPVTRYNPQKHTRKVVSSDTIARVMSRRKLLTIRSKMRAKCREGKSMRRSKDQRIDAHRRSILNDKRPDR